MNTFILRTATFGFIFFVSFLGVSQTSEYPNVTKDLVGEKPFWGTVNFEMTISGYTGGSLEGMYIKPNLLFVRANAGLSFVNNLDYKKLENAKHDWWSPIGNFEVGYPFRLGIRKASKKWIAAQSTYSDRKNNTYRETDYYKVKVPKHFLLTPVVGLNYEATPFRIRELANLSNEFIFNQRILTLSAGIRLLTLMRCDLAIKDSKSGKSTTGSANRYGGIYLGMDMGLQEEYETSAQYTSIVKSENPTYEVIFSIPSGFVNTIAFIEFGVKGTPYIRRDRIDDSGALDRTTGSAQFYFAFKSYL